MHLADIRHPENLYTPTHFGPGSKRGRGDEADSALNEELEGTPYHFGCDPYVDEELEDIEPEPPGKRQRHCGMDDDSFGLPFEDDYDDTIFSPRIPNSNMATPAASASNSAASTPFATPSSTPASSRPSSPSRRRRARKSSEPTPSTSRGTRTARTRKTSDTSNLASRFQNLSFIPLKMVRLRNTNGRVCTFTYAFFINE